MRIDWPSERAACGSFFDPNSTMITTATIRIFHGLSNRSPIMTFSSASICFLAEWGLGQILPGNVTGVSVGAKPAATRPSATRLAAAASLIPAGGGLEGGLKQ